MTEKTSLSDILNDAEPKAEVEAEEVETEAQPEEATEEAEPETAERPRGPDGKFIKKGESDEPEAPAAEAPPASEETQGNIPIAALKDERAKRQALEAELMQMRNQFAQMQQPQAQPEQGPPDRWEDPEGYDRWLINQATTQATQQARTEATQAYQTQRIQMSAQEAKAKLPDYAEKMGVFEQMVNVNPGLVDQLYQAPNPAQFAYETAKMQMEISQYGGLEALIEARVKAREAELLQKAPAALPPSISSDRSVGARSGPAWGGPTPLGDILK